MRPGSGFDGKLVRGEGMVVRRMGGLMSTKEGNLRASLS